MGGRSGRSVGRSGFLRLCGRVGRSGFRCVRFSRRSLFLVACVGVLGVRWSGRFSGLASFLVWFISELCERWRRFPLRSFGLRRRRRRRRFVSSAFRLACVFACVFPLPSLRLLSSLRLRFLLSFVGGFCRSFRGSCAFPLLVFVLGVFFLVVAFCFSVFVLFSAVFSLFVFVCVSVLLVCTGVFSGVSSSGGVRLRLAVSVGVLFRQRRRGGRVGSVRGSVRFGVVGVLGRGGRRSWRFRHRPPTGSGVFFVGIVGVFAGCDQVLEPAPVR